MNNRLYLRTCRLSPRVPPMLHLPPDYVPGNKRKPRIRAHVVLNAMIAALLLWCLGSMFYIGLSKAEALQRASVRVVVE